MKDLARTQTEAQTESRATEIIDVNKVTQLK
jgi:hypothetical protein